MKFKLPASVTRSCGRLGLQIKKHSPEILVVVGVVGTVVSAVMACKATTKAPLVLEETKQNLDVIHAGAEKGEVIGHLENGEIGMVPYTPEDAQKDTTIVYAKTGMKFVKLYAPAVLLGAASIASILTGHNILRKRNLALAAAYTAVDTSFKQYRKRLVERLGEKMDKEIFYNIKATEVEETVVDENGNETVVKKTVEVADPSAPGFGMYTFVFDETSSNWQRDPEANKYFLARQQDYANDKLKSRGYMTLNEVLEMLGMPVCRMGQIVGWVYDKDKEEGDGFIDFGILNIHSKENRAFINGLEPSIWLNFNVDGDILDKL